MREEYVKNKDHPDVVDGVEVFNLGEEYVFTLRDKEGKEIEYHLTKPHMHEIENYIKAKKIELENKK